MKKYQVIYADPAWSYYNDMTVLPNVTTVRGMRRPPYPVLSSDDIAKLPISKITDDNCILFIWSTDYHLEKCINKVIPSWGFEYKTIGFVWEKLNKNNTPVCFMGAYTMKSGVEFCLLATKGKLAHKMVISHKVRSLVKSVRLEHSKKPEIVRDRIVDLVGNVSKIELFATERFPNWDAWGNKINSDIDLEF